MVKVLAGRRGDMTIVACERCGWSGMVKETVHGYGDDGTGEDVVPVDECPECGYEV